MELIIAICALILSLVNSFWQLINGLKNLKVELKDWYINECKNSKHKFQKHFVFCLSFINKSFNSISISSISIKYKNYIQKLDYEKTTLLFKPIKDSNGAVVYENRLYSHEIPFRIDGLGVDIGYFGVWDIPDQEYLDNNPTVEIIIDTNRGKIKKKVVIPNRKDIFDIKF